MSLRSPRWFCWEQLRLCAQSISGNPWVEIRSFPRTTCSLHFGVNCWGLSIEWGVQLALNDFGKVFIAQLPSIDPEWLKLTIGIGVALMTVPATMLATRLGNQQMLCAGLLVTAGFSGLMVLLPTPIIMAICCNCFSNFSKLVNQRGSCICPSNGTAGKGRTRSWDVLHGTAAGSSLFGMFNQPEQIPLDLGVLIGAIAILLLLATGSGLPERYHPKLPLA